MGAKKTKKAEEEEDVSVDVDVDTDEEEEEEEEEEETEKSSIAASDLMKSIEAYGTVEAAIESGGGSREAELMAKVRAGTISKSEQRELGQLWADGNEPLAKSESPILDFFSEDEEGQQVLDAAPVLKSVAERTDHALRNLSDVISRESDITRTLLKGQGNLQKSIAHLVVQQDEVIRRQGKLIKSMQERMEQIAAQPAVRKSVGHPDPRDLRTRNPGNLAKSGAGAGGDELSASDIKRGLMGLTKSASEAGDNKAVDALVKATSMFETSGRVHPNILKAIEQFNANEPSITS